MTDSLPARPAIGMFALAALALATAGRFAERGVEGARRLSDPAEAGGEQAILDLLEQEGANPTARTLAQLALASSGGLGLEVESIETAEEPHPESAEAVRARRPEGWVYPAFEAPERGLHGPAAAPRPRNLEMTLVGPVGEPFEPESLEAVQNGPDGRFELRGHSGHAAPGHWVLGTPALTTGEAASFELRAVQGGEEWVGVFDLMDVPVETDVTVGLPVEMRPVAPR